MLQNTVHSNGMHKEMPTSIYDVLGVKLPKLNSALGHFMVVMIRVHATHVIQVQQLMFVKRDYIETLQVSA